MAWYRSGTVTSVAGQNVITGTGTQWANNVMGVAPGQAFIVQRANGNTLIYEILAVDSNTRIRINGNVVDALVASNYGIQTSVSNSYSALARETSAQLALYQQLLEDWQNITTGTGDVTIIAPDGTEVVIPALGEGSLVPIGVPLPYPLATPPAGFLKCNGSSFSTAEYPKLALAYPSGVLPDLRGEFIRGWDDGRGVDVSRTLLSAQGDAIRNIKGEQSLDVPYNGKSTGVFYNNGKNANQGIYEDGSFIFDAPSVGGTGGLNTSQGEKIFFDASRIVPTASENRPRNIAFNYIVRAI